MALAVAGALCLLLPLAGLGTAIARTPELCPDCHDGAADFTGLLQLHRSADAEGAYRKDEDRPCNERLRELEQIVREAVGLKLCSADNIESGKGTTGGSIWIVKVPKSTHEVCNTDEDMQLKFAVKYTPSIKGAPKRDDDETELEVLKVVSGMKGFVQYLGMRRIANARYTFMQAANLDLEHFLAKHGKKKYTFQMRVNLLIQTLHALAQLEEVGIQHLDLKPENILLEGQCETRPSKPERLPMRSGGQCHVVLADFGAACGRLKGLEVPCRVIGSNEWTSPELATLRRTELHKSLANRNNSNVPSKWSVPKNDVWAAGLIAFQVLVGVARPGLFAFYGMKPGRIEWNDVLPGKMPDVIRRLKLQVPKPWLPLLEGMLQPSVEKRWTMKMASEAADRIAQGQGIETPRAYEASAAMKALKELFSHAVREGRLE